MEQEKEDLKGKDDDLMGRLLCSQVKMRRRTVEAIPSKVP